MNYRHSYLISIFLLLSLFSFFLVHADSNGVWHQAEDVRGGTFGDDEQSDTSSYTFINPVTIDDRLTITGGNIELSSNDLTNAGIVGARQFEDTDNAQYVLDPSGTSRLESLRLQGSQNCELLRTDASGNIVCGKDQVGDGDISTTNELQNLANVLARGNNAGGRNIVNAGVLKTDRLEAGTIESPTLVSGSNLNFYLDRGSNDGDEYFAVRDDSNVWRFLVRENGRVDVRNELYAPIMYDRNNANYWVNPSSTSYLNGIRTNAIKLQSKEDCDLLRTDEKGRIYCGNDQVNDGDSSSSNELQNLAGVLTRGNNAGGRNVQGVGSLRARQGQFAGSVQVGGVIRANTMRSDQDNRYHVDLAGSSTFKDLKATQDFRAPRMIDTSNSNYQINPDGRSRMNRVDANRVEANQVITGDVGGGRWCRAGSGGRIYCNKASPGETINNVRMEKRNTQIECGSGRNRFRTTGTAIRTCVNGECSNWVTSSTC